MKYVKGAIIVGEREIMVELPSDWSVVIGAEKFLMCRSYVGEDTAFNTAMIFNVREVSEAVWKNWLTRMEMVKERLQEEALKEAGADKKEE